MTTGRIELLNGTPLYFEVHGTGDPVLLLHGFSGSSADWKSTISQWGGDFQLIVPDLRGHGRSGILSEPFRHRDAAGDILALLDHLRIDACKGLGISAGGNILLHMATRRPDRLKAMVLVSATSYFPPQARAIMRKYPDSLAPAQREFLRSRHPRGDPQIETILASTKAFADSYDDMNFTPPYLSTIQARTLIVQGDRDPLCPVEISIEMAKAIPHSSLWIVPDAGHGPVIGDRWSEFLETAGKFLRRPSTPAISAPSHVPRASRTPHAGARPRRRRRQTNPQPPAPNPRPPIKGLAQANAALEFTYVQNCRCCPSDPADRMGRR